MKQVLVVEDTLSVAAALILTIENLGWKADYARNVAEVLTLLESGYVPDLVLADVDLKCGDGGGISVAAVMVERGIKVILITGSRSEAVDFSGASFKMPVPVLRKPFGVKELLALLE